MFVSHMLKMIFFNDDDNCKQKVSQEFVEKNATLIAFKT